MKDGKLARNLLIQFAILAVVVLPGCNGTQESGSDFYSFIEAVRNKISKGCASGDEPDFDISGTFRERFNCIDLDDGSCIENDVTLITTVTQVQDTNTFDTEDDAAGTSTGTLCANVFEWVGGGLGFTETGTWEFNGPDKYTSNSTGRNDGPGGLSFQCTGRATRGENSNPPAPAPIGDCD